MSEEPASEAPSDDRLRLGHTGEAVATEHLRRRGYRILERNYRTRWGELDIVALDGETIVFCEVKARRLPTLRAARGAAGAAADLEGRTPLESVHPRKRRQVRRMAASWLAERRDRPYAAELRFDAIGVTFDASGRLSDIEHLEAAF